MISRLQCVMAIKFSSARLGVGKAIILEAGPISNRYHVKEGGGTIQWDRLNNALVQPEEEMGGQHGAP